MVSPSKSVTTTSRADVGVGRDVEGPGCPPVRARAHPVRPVARPSARPRYVRVAALTVILALALTLRLWGVAWGLHNATVSLRPHPDEWPIYWLFRWFRSGDALNPCPSAPGRCFFDWGMAFPYLGYLAHFLLQPILTALPLSFGPKADPQFVWPTFESRIVSALLSTASVGVVYLLGRIAYGTVAGLIAALLLALATLSIQLGHFATPDSTTVFLVSLALLAGWRAVEHPSSGHFALAGGAAGLAAGSEYHMVLLAVPTLTAWLLAGGRPSWLAAAGLAALGAFVVANPYALVEFPAFVTAGEHTVRIRTIESSTQYGDRFSSFGPAWSYVVRYALGYGIGWPMTMWTVLSVLWAAFRRTRADYFLLSWLLPYFVLVSVSPARFMRYSAPLLIPLVILAGRAAAEGFRTRGITAVSVTLAAAAVSAYTVVYDAAYVGVFASPDTRATATAWVSQHASAGEYLGFPALPDGLLNLPYYADMAGYRPCIANYQARTIPAARYILFDTYTMEEHPRASDAEVAAFKHALSAGARYSLATRIRSVPTFLGITFSIAGSPHDWRYASHDILIYARRGAPRLPSPHCFDSLKSASAALYSPSHHT